MKLTIKTFNQLSAQELYEILRVRFKVFVMEQKCWYLDMDRVDYNAVHLYLSDESDIVAYARLYQREDGNWRFGRMLTLQRGKGLGKQLVHSIVDKAQSLGAKSLGLDAQMHAVGFYEQLGFTVCSKPFEEAGIEHVEMIKVF